MKGKSGGLFSLGLKHTDVFARRLVDNSTKSEVCRIAVYKDRLVFTDSTSDVLKSLQSNRGDAFAADEFTLEEKETWMAEQRVPTSVSQ